MAVEAFVQPTAIISRGWVDANFGHIYCACALPKELEPGWYAMHGYKGTWTWSEGILRIMLTDGWDSCS